MIYAYTNFLDPNHDRLDLCITPQKPDPFSLPLKIDSLFETTAAFVRLSTTEGINVAKDRTDGGLIIEPLVPTKLYITTCQTDRPGVSVKSIKVLKNGDGSYSSWYREEGRETTEWKVWNPNAPR